jgi:NAD(P)H-flavin reductase
LSKEKGLGLQLESLSSQKIGIVAGGTGLFPFYDILDLFFKSELMETNKY